MKVNHSRHFDQSDLEDLRNAGQDLSLNASQKDDKSQKGNEVDYDGEYKSEDELEDMLSQVDSVYTAGSENIIE
jgi:hypothetical protein